MKYPAYPSYRPTRVKCFEELPDTWTVRRLRFLVHGIDQGWSPQASNMPAEDGEMGVLKLSAVGDGAFSPCENKHLEEIPEGQVILTPKAQDVLMTRANTPSLVGDVCHVPQDYPDLIIPDLIYRVRVDQTKVAPRFLMYVLLSRAGRSQIESVARGSSASMVKLGQGHLKDFQIPLPPHEEQRKVIAFLDWKIAQIDALLDKKKELIKRLKEMRLTVITQAVTKGLDPTTLMRNSGIDWIGQVPSPWVMKRVRHCAGMVTSGSRGWAQYYSDSGDLFLRITNLDRESIQLLLDDLQRVDPPEGAEGARTRTEAGDLLISITADLGSVTVIPPDFEPAYVSQHLALVRIDSMEVDPHWIAYSVFSCIGKHQLRLAGYGGTKIQLSLQDIKEIVFFHPPNLEEQKDVLDYIKTQTEDLDGLVDVVSRAIAGLTEYRTALITDAVTGKIDVRGVQIPVQP